MRMPWLLVPATWLLLAAGPSQPDLAISQELGIEGSWTLVSLYNKPYPPGYFWVIDARKIRIYINGRLTSPEYTYVLDRSGKQLEFQGPDRKTTYKVKVKGDRLLVGDYDFKRVQRMEP